MDTSPASLYFGQREDLPMEFTVEILCERTMDVVKQTRIKDWLFGGRGWKRLQICAKHMSTFYYNCRLQPVEDINNYGYDGFRVQVQCDSPYAREFWKTREIAYSGANHSFYFNNRSEDIEHLKPIVEFKLGGTNEAFSLASNKGGGKKMAFTGLQAGETITVDCANNFIESSTGLIRLDNFNGWFFRIPKGVNTLTASGALEWLRIRYQNLKRLGGGFV